MRDSALVSSGLLKSGLRRFWPVWLVYFVALVLLLVMPIYSSMLGIVGEYGYQADYASQLESVWSLAYLAMLFYSLVSSLVVAVVLNDHLFDGRSATFMGSLPIRRRGVFLTIFVTGLLALFVVLAAVALCMMPLCIMAPGVFKAGMVVRWFVFSAAVTFVFYSIAQLACQLSATRAVAVLLYGVANFLVACLEGALLLVVPTLMYGISSWDLKLDWLSPFVGMGIRVINTMAIGGSLDWLVILAYVVAALVIAVFAGILYERRNLEVAGDSIAFARLRPVLKYLAGVSLALLFASVFCLLRLSNYADGMPATAGDVLALVVALVLGGFLGVLFAEMIMSRSTRVLGRCWRGGLILAIISIVFVGACYFDLLGIVRRVPAPDEVQSVSMSIDYGEYTTLTSEEAIEQTCDLHRDIIAYGGEGSRSDEYTTLRISYQLANGQILERTYQVPGNYVAYLTGDRQAEEGDVLIDRFASLLDTEEGRMSRLSDVLDTDADALGITVDYVASSSGVYESITLTPEERADLLENALRLDLMEEPAGGVLYGWGVMLVPENDACIYVERKGSYDTLLNLQLSEEGTPHTLAWLHEHHPEIEG